MNLSLKDRLVLINQYNILELLKPEEKKHYANLLEVLENGFELEYETLFSSIDNEVVSIQECKEVLDILEMFKALKFSFYQLEDKSGIEENKIKFQGFDGNHELKQMTYARFLKKTERFTDILDNENNNNSHFPN